MTIQPTLVAPLMLLPSLVVAAAPAEAGWSPAVPVPNSSDAGWSAGIR
jgi:hypothetical protein